MSVLSKLTGQQQLTRSQKLVVLTSLASLAVWTYTVIGRNGKRSSKSNDEIQLSFKRKQEEGKRANNQPVGKMVSQVSSILSLIWGPKEYMYALGIAGTLVLRTISDLWLINNGTQIEAGIITADLAKLQSNIGQFFLAMPTLALLNNLLKFLINQLRLSVRCKLSQKLYNNYLDGLTFYRINSLDNNCQNVDQLLTNDVDKFASALVDVYTNVAKPLLDVIILFQRMTITYTGVATPATMMGYLVIAGFILTSSRRPLTRLTVQETQLEGQLRYVHSRLITNCEEIAFYQGNNREKSVLMSALMSLQEHLYDLSIFRFRVEFVENLLTRYFATVVGYLALAIPFFSARYSDRTQSYRLENYYKSGRMMVKMAESMGRLLLASRSFTKLAAYANLVNQLKSRIEENKKAASGLLAVAASPSSPGGAEASSALVNSPGVIEYCDSRAPLIKFISVPLVTPNGDVLIDNLNVTIKHGQNVIVTGPNGSGKSSLFRILGELWPLTGGKLIKPRPEQLFYIPQKPYLALGTLRDQIIYPDSLIDVKRKGLNDLNIASILEKVELSYLLEREGSFDSVQDWSDVLSGGEKQRIAIARLIYHQPLYAILDECTSAVSIDVEQRIYKYLTESTNCSLLSVSHRVKQLSSFHSYILQFHGVGSGYTFAPLTNDATR